MPMRLQLLSPQYLPYYQRQQPYTLQKHLNKLQKRPTDAQELLLQITNAAVYSSLIEGNPIDINSYFRFTEAKINLKSKPYRQIQDLIKSYYLAQNLFIGWQNLMRIHKTLAKTLLQDNRQHCGKIRTAEIGIFNAQGFKVYSGAPAVEVKTELQLLLSDVKKLIGATLTIDEVFYYAAMIHLRFAQIHPFADGNGRTARLLEKWFLAQKLGYHAWSIHSEMYYQMHLSHYYQNIHLGSNYHQLNYDLCLPFLLMLPKALRYSV